MKTICCFLQDFQEYGLFIGCQLLKKEGEPQKIIKSVKFYNEVSVEIVNFLDVYAYSKNNLEKWFNR